MWAPSKALLVASHVRGGALQVPRSYLHASTHWTYEVRGSLHRKLKNICPTLSDDSDAQNSLQARRLRRLKQYNRARELTMLHTNPRRAHAAPPPPLALAKALAIQWRTIRKLAKESMRAGAPAAPRATSATAPATPESPAARGDPKRPHTKKAAPQQRPRAGTGIGGIRTGANDNIQNDSKRNALLAALKSQATEPRARATSSSVIWTRVTGTTGP